MIRIIGTEKEIKGFINEYLDCPNVSENICEKYMKEKSCEDCILENTNNKYTFEIEKDN